MARQPPHVRLGLRERGVKRFAELVFSKHGCVFHAGVCICMCVLVFVLGWYLCVSIYLCVYVFEGAGREAFRRVGLLEPGVGLFVSLLGWRLVSVYMRVCRMQCIRLCLCLCVSCTRPPTHLHTPRLCIQPRPPPALGAGHRRRRLPPAQPGAGGHGGRRPVCM